MLIDITKCVGCKGCEVACKEWYQLPAEIETGFIGYQSHKDLSYNRYTHVKFFERELEDGTLAWNFRKAQCMHCAEPACVAVCPTDALTQTEEGIVNFEWEACIGCRYCETACPFDIPKYSEKDNKVDKCTLCFDRVGHGEEPACAKTCPTRAIRFGEREEMLAYGARLVSEYKAAGKTAMLYNPAGVGGTHVVYVLPTENPEEFDLPADPKVPAQVNLWQGVLKPAGEFLVGASIFAGLVGLGIGLSRSGQNAHGEGGEKHEG